MKTLFKILGGLITIALICGAGYGAYVGLRLTVRAFRAPTFHVDPITALSWSVMLLTALIIANSIRRAGQQMATAQLLKGKSEAYQVFVSLWTSLLQPGLSRETRNHPKTEGELKALDGLLALSASSAVVKAHAQLREMERKCGAEDPGVHSQFTATLLEIRRDLGLESRSFGMKELAYLVFTAPEGGPTGSRAPSQLDAQPRVSLAPN